MSLDSSWRWFSKDAFGVWGGGGGGGGGGHSLGCRGWGGGGLGFGVQRGRRSHHACLRLWPLGLHASTYPHEACFYFSML